MKLNALSLFLFISILSTQAQKNNCYISANPQGFQLIIDSCNNEIIIDARPNEVFKNQIIENAILVPTKNELINLVDTLDTDTPIMVYCAIGMRSKKVCELLCNKEFNFVVNLKGGIDKWKKKEFNTITIEKIAKP